MSVSITELICQAKTWGKSIPGSAFILKCLFFHWKPIHYTKTDAVHDPYGVHYMWPVFRHCFRLLLCKMREKHHFQWEDSGHIQTWVMRVTGTVPFLFFLFYWRSYSPVEIWSMIFDKNNLRIDYKHRLTCFYELLWYFFRFFFCLVTTWFHMCYLIVLMSSLLFYNIENSQNKEKPLNESVCPKLWLVL